MQVESQLSQFIYKLEQAGYDVAPDGIRELRSLIETGLQTAGMVDEGPSPAYRHGGDYAKAARTLQDAIVEEAKEDGASTIGAAHVQLAMAKGGWRFWPFTGGAFAGEGR